MFIKCLLNCDHAPLMFAKIITFESNPYYHVLILNVVQCCSYKGKIEQSKICDFGNYITSVI